MEHLIRLVILPLLILAMASLIPCNATQAQTIYDTDGHEVTSEDLYHILPANRSLGCQGLYASPLGQHGCLRRVILTRCMDGGRELGEPVSIKPAANDSEGQPPRLSNHVVIGFNHTLSTCMMRLQWYIHGEITNQMHVTVGHDIGASERHQPAWDDRFLFRIERHVDAGPDAPGGYKLMSCYRAGGAGDGAPCLHLGLYEYRNRKWLTVLPKDRHEPLAIVFKKCPPPCWSGVMRN